MPDETIAPVAPAPESVTPPTPTAAAPAAPTPPAQPSSTQSLISEMENLRNPEPEKTEPPKTDAQPKTDPKLAAVTPVKEKDPVSLRKKLAEIEQEYNGFKLTATQEREKLAAKIAEFEKRKYLTPEQEQQQKAMESRLKQVESEFYARDYKESPEFKEFFEKRWQDQYKTAVDGVSTITIVDDNGDTRAANRADFEKVRNAPNGVELRRAAKQIFGEDADFVIDQVSQLLVIQDSAKKELETRKAEYDSRMKAQVETRQKSSEIFDTVQTDTDKKMREKWPQYFGEDPEDKESNEALKRGADFISTSLEGRGKLSSEDVATRSAIIKNWAASFPRLVHKLEKSDAEIKALKETISKLRGSDPGSIDGGSGEGVAVTKGGGINELIAQFEE